jgi:hypothetical protein
MFNVPLDGWWFMDSRNNLRERIPRLPSCATRCPARNCRIEWVKCRKQKSPGLPGLCLMRTPTRSGYLAAQVMITSTIFGTRKSMTEPPRFLPMASMSPDSNHRWSDFSQFRSSCAGHAGKNRNRHRIGQRPNGGRLNLNPRGRRIESYCMDKSENGNPSWRGNCYCGWDNHA